MYSWLPVSYQIIRRRLGRIWHLVIDKCRTQSRDRPNQDMKHSQSVWLSLGRDRIRIA